MKYALKNSDIIKPLDLYNQSLKINWQSLVTRYGERIFDVVTNKLYIYEYKDLEMILRENSVPGKLIDFLISIALSPFVSVETDAKKEYFDGDLEDNLYEYAKSRDYIKQPHADKFIQEYGLSIFVAVSELGKLQEFNDIMSGFVLQDTKNRFVYLVNEMLWRDKPSIPTRIHADTITGLIQNDVYSKIQSVKVDIGKDIFASIIDHNNNGEYFIIAPNHMIANNYYAKKLLLPYDFFCLQQLFDKNESSCGPVALVNRPMEDFMQQAGISERATEEIMKYYVGGLYNGVPVFKNKAETQDKFGNSKRNHAVFVAKKNKPTNIVRFPSGTQKENFEEEIPLLKTTVFNNKRFPGRKVIPTYIEERPVGHFHIAFGEPIDTVKPELVKRNVHIAHMKEKYIISMVDLRQKLDQKKKDYILKFSMKDNRKAKAMIE